MPNAVIKLAYVLETAGWPCCEGCKHTEMDGCHVGYSTALRERLEQHANDKRWWPEVRTVQFGRYLHAGQRVSVGRRTETRMIRELDPPRNRTLGHRRGQHGA